MNKQILWEFSEGEWGAATEMNCQKGNENRFPCNDVARFYSRSFSRSKMRVFG